MEDDKNILFSEEIRSMSNLESFKFSNQNSSRNPQPHTFNDSLKVFDNGISPDKPKSEKFILSKKSKSPQKTNERNITPPSSNKFKILSFKNIDKKMKFHSSGQDQQNIKNVRPEPGYRVSTEKSAHPQSIDKKRKEFQKEDQMQVHFMMSSSSSSSRVKDNSIASGINFNIFESNNSPKVPEISQTPKRQEVPKEIPLPKPLKKTLKPFQRKFGVNQKKKSKTKIKKSNKGLNKLVPFELKMNKKTKSHNFRQNFGQGSLSYFKPFNLSLHKSKDAMSRYKPKHIGKLKKKPKKQEHFKRMGSKQWIENNLKQKS
jgi:hypothetical protein